MLQSITTAEVSNLFDISLVLMAQIAGAQVDPKDLAATGQKI